MNTGSKHTLQFGALDWKGRPVEGGYWMCALAEGASFGNAEPVERELANQLLDGSISERQRYDNRTATFDVFVEAPNSIALAEGAAALGRECDSPSTLTFTPPDGLGVTTVFEVVTAAAAWVFDDQDELKLRRRFRVTIQCLPFGKSPAATTYAVAVVGSPAGDESVNVCDALTGFAGVGASTAVLDTSVKYEGTGSVRLTGQPRTLVPSPVQGQNLNVPSETGSVELTGLSLTTPATRPFISFKGYAGQCLALDATLHVNGVAATLISTERLNAEWAMFTFRTDVTDTITSLRMTETVVGDVMAIFQPSWGPRIDDIRRNGATGSSARQALRSATVGGSARTPGSLAVSATDGLGKVLLLTTPALAAGFTPDLMRRCVDSTTTDAGSISGKVKAFGTSPVAFEFPAAMIAPGSYQLIGFLQTGTLAETGGARVEVGMSTKAGSVTLSTDSHAQRIDETADGVFEFVDCGPITLPTSQVPPGSAAVVRLEIGVMDHLEAAGGTTVPRGSSFQDFYLIPLVDDTALNIVNCGGTGTATIGTANSRLWIDSATLASRTPSMWVGTQEDRSDAYHAGSAAKRWQPLSLSPPEVLLFMANSGGTNASVALTYTKAWQGLAAE